MKLVLLFLIAVCSAPSTRAASQAVVAGDSPHGNNARKLLAAQVGPTCASQQMDYCRNFWCPLLGCNLAVEPELCARQCPACCSALDLQLVFFDPSCENPPQCQAYLRSYYGKDYDYDKGKGCGQVVNGECDNRCGNLCPTGDEVCNGLCGACCKARLQHRCQLFSDYPAQEQPQCKQLQEKYPDVYDDICFPADATVTTDTGAVKRMDQLNIGDKVAVMHKDGKLAHSEVYQFAHRDPNALGLSYIALQVQATAGNYTLTLSETHYLTVANSDGGPTLVTAAKAQVGQQVWVMHPIAKSLVLATITGKAHRLSVGAYNPMTLDGAIIVNGVVASSFNDWVGANTVVPESWKPVLPKIYEGLLAGHRLGYRLAGPERWAAWNDVYDLSGLSVRRSLTAVAVKAALAMNQAQSKA